MQAILRMIYPPRCLSCGDLVDRDFALCGICWRDTPFIRGLACGKCGAPLLGEDDGGEMLCDDCIAVARPWHRGVSALRYDANARKMVLALKWGDRLDLVRPAADWMARVARPLLRDDMLVVPVPLYWTRLLRRRYNQSALLADALARVVNRECCPDLLIRKKQSRISDGLSRAERFASLSDAIVPHPKRKGISNDRAVLLVDDVMTTGATLSACTDACIAAGASEVCVVILARVAKNT